MPHFLRDLKLAGGIRAQSDTGVKGVYCIAMQIRNTVNEYVSSNLSLHFDFARQCKLWNKEVNP